MRNTLKGATIKISTKNLTTSKSILQTLSFIPKKRWWQVGFSIAVFIFSYSSVFLALMKAWYGSNAYSYGFMVPLISIYLIWARRDKLRNIPVQADAILGILTVSFAGFLLLIGNLGSVLLIKELSLVVMIAGLVILLLGRLHLKALCFPIVYLLLMIPFFEISSDRIHWPFQLLAAKMGTMFLQGLGVPAFRKFQYIELPNITLEVAVLCSGIRYLTSIVAIGTPLAYLTQRTWVRRIGLISMSVIIAILANVARVALVGLWSYYREGTNIHGPSELFQGLLVAQVAFVFLFVGAWVLTRIPCKTLQEKRDIEIPRGKVISSVNKRQFVRSWSAAIVILISIGVYPYLFKYKTIPLVRDLHELPQTVRDWKGYHTDPIDAFFRVQGADNEMTMSYKNISGREIKLYIGYFESQHQDKELINFLSRGLHLGSGEIDLHIGQQKSIRVNRKVFREGSRNELILFWYDLNGRTFTSLYKAKLTTLFYAITSGYTNGAIIMISTGFSDQDDLQVAMKQIEGFSSNLLPIIGDFIPRF